MSSVPGLSRWSSSLVFGPRNWLYDPGRRLRTHISRCKERWALSVTDGWQDFFSSERCPRTTTLRERSALRQIQSNHCFFTTTVLPSSRLSPPMASKPPVNSPGSSGSLALAQHPQSIDISSKLLSSAIPLPLNASVVYAAFSPTNSPTLHDETVELARRHIIDIGKPSLLESLLCTVYVEKGTQQLYVFSIISSDGTGDLFHSIRSLHFDGLIRKSFCLQFPFYVFHSSIPILGTFNYMLRCMQDVILMVPLVQSHKYHLSVLPKFTIISQRSQQEIGHPLPITYRTHMQSMRSLPYSQWKPSGYPTLCLSKPCRRG